MYNMSFWLMDQHCSARAWRCDLVLPPLTSWWPWQPIVSSLSLSWLELLSSKSQSWWLKNTLHNRYQIKMEKNVNLLNICRGLHGQWHKYILYLAYNVSPLQKDTLFILSCYTLWYIIDLCHLADDFIQSDLDMQPNICLHTVPMESIQTPWLFPHFLTLQLYSTK